MSLRKKLILLFVFALAVLNFSAAFANDGYFKVLYGSNTERFDESADPKIKLTSNVGHARVIENFDGEHKNVINLGVASGDANAKNDTSQINISNTGDLNKNVCFEFDIMTGTDSLPTAKRLTLIKRNSSTSQPKLFEADGSKFYSGGNTYAYTPGNWYTVIVNADMENGLYGVSVKDNEGNVTVISENVSQTLSVSSWRFYGTVNKTDYHEFYLDNFKFYKYEKKPDGYTDPKAVIEAESFEKYLGESIDFTLNAEGTQIESASVYVNGEHYADYTSFPASVSINCETFGEYTVTAEVKNVYGITGSDEKTFTVKENNPPSVVFDGISGSVTFKENGEMKLSVTALDDAGIAKLELYVDGKLVSETDKSTMSFDFASLNPEYGKYSVRCIAYDIYNLSSEAEISVIIQPDGYIEPTVEISAESLEAVCGAEAVFTFRAQTNHFECVDIFVDGQLYKTFDQKELTFGIKRLSEGKCAVKAVVKDTLGKEGSASAYVVFKLPEGYIAPSVDVTCEKDSVKLGETLKAAILCAGTHYESTDVYINGSLYKTFEQENFSVLYTPQKSGSVSIKAVITDIFGKTAQSELKFTVAENDKPKVLFDKISDGGYIGFSYYENKNMSVSASDSDKIEKIEIYADGVLKKTFASDAAEFDFESLETGLGKCSLKAVAYDIYGLSGETSVTVEVTNLSKELKIQNSDFESGVSFTVNRGHAYAGEYDESHGKSIIIGMAEGDGDPKADYSSVNISSGGYNHTEFTFDICVDKKPSGTGLTLAVRTVDSGNVKIPIIFYVNGANFVSGGKSFSYEIGKWYTVAVDVNFAAKVFGTTVYDGANEIPLAKNSVLDAGTFSSWRFYTGTNKADYCEFALDNFKFYEIVSAPCVKSVGYDDKTQADIIPVTAKTINVMLDGSLVADDINSENVSLFAGGEKTELEKVRYDTSENKIMLVLNESLAADENYTVVIGKNVRISLVRVLGADIRASFKTGSSDVKFSNTDLKIKKDNTGVLTFDAENLLKNGEEYAKVPVCVIVTLWDKDKRFEKTFAKDFVISEAKETFSLDIDADVRKTAEIYFADSFENLNIYDKTVINYSD